MSSGRTVELEWEGGKILFRRPQREDWLFVQREFPLVPELLGREVTEVGELIEFYGGINRMLERCAKRPKLREGAISENGIVDTMEISFEDRRRMYLALMELAGWTKEAAEEIAPLPETAGNS